ncbi:MAG: zf-HC2 domain-containing protein [Burkholderiaceae bacterium]|jgi:hypothetical protein
MSFINRNCREVTRLILEREHRPLTTVERLAVRLHLGICLMCTRFTGQLAVMNRALDAWKSYREQDADEQPGPAAE